MHRAADEPLVVGICGSQGSGKSTLAGALSKRFGYAPVVSLDDLYLPREERRILAQEVHPLLATRGVPGTHDVALGIRVIDGLRARRCIQLPRFDKGIDDRVPEADWPLANPHADVVLLEGWCLGARPQAEAELEAPINRLELEEDPDGRWREFVNAELALRYQSLFSQVDLLVFLAAPSFEVVHAWRSEQEMALRRSSPDSAMIMDDATLDRFVFHFERLTRHLLCTMPAYADLVLQLDRDRRCVRSYSKL